MPWAPDYCTAAELKSYLRITDVADDAHIALAVTAASRAIDHAANRQFGVTVDEARHYTARWDTRRRRYVVDIDDTQDATVTVALDEEDDGTWTTAVPATDFTLQPRNAVDRSRPFTQLVFDLDATVTPPLTDEAVQVTALWGWTAVPDTIKQATLLQAARFFARRNAPFGIAGSPDAGSEMRLLARIDPDVAVAVNAYRRVWAAA